jgi:hypothetical protein
LPSNSFLLASQQSHSAKFLSVSQLKQLSGLRPAYQAKPRRAQAYQAQELRPEPTPTLVSQFATRLVAPHTGPHRASSGQTMRKHHIENVLAKKYTNRSSATRERCDV